MPEYLDPATPSPDIEDGQETYEGLRVLSRSPHPYHRQKFELLEPSDRLVYRPPAAAAAVAPASTAKSGTAEDGDLRRFTKESTPSSDSGTEADDEHILKRLPAPKAKLHKGLRGKDELLSGTSTPVLSPNGYEEGDLRTMPLGLKGDLFGQDQRVSADRARLRKEIVRRVTELLLLICQGGIVQSNPAAQPTVRAYRSELIASWSILPVLAALYPLRVVIWAYSHGSPSRAIPLSIPTSFDPAPIFYPPVVPVLVAFLVSSHVEGVVLPNMVLSICTIPGQLIPTLTRDEPFNGLHWLLTCLPIYMRQATFPLHLLDNGPSAESLTLLYPMHQTLCALLHNLTTTSLLPAELQLLSVSLINVLLLAYSPQTVIMKALLWGGGLSLIILCGPAVRRGIALARVPKWRFKRAPVAPGGSTFRFLTKLLTPRGHKHDVFVSDAEGSTEYETENSSDENYEAQVSGFASSPKRGTKRSGSISVAERASSIAAGLTFGLPGSLHGLSRSSKRRHTLPSLQRSGDPGGKTHTPSGRRKRSASSSVRAFFSLTQAEASARKWLYSGYVYICILAVILVGIRTYVERYALAGDEPMGWALGYLFGNLPWFRFQVVQANLENWVCLPALRRDCHAESCYMGWVQHVRHASFGAANTRLFLSGYWLAVIVVGLAVVFKLSPVYEVDTRRKVFHFMMVAMFLPATFIDPTYVALALSIALAIFLLLDLLRASQLPPLSKPIASFLTPYVDGRDLRGPVVISHIFLLIGCAIPLWLALAAIPRFGNEHMAGWEVPTRDISMVSGIVCVGLGDAAASLIGRRWGHRKWLWGGGKSLEGSVAFGAAAFVGLLAAYAWLKIGGWPAASAATEELSLWSLRDWMATATKTGACASMASLTEAVLTGGNDNVIVPVVLWTCVKSMDI